MFSYNKKLDTSILISWGMNAKNHGGSCEGIFLAIKMNKLDLRSATLISKTRSSKLQNAT